MGAAGRLFEEARTLGWPATCASDGGDKQAAAEKMMQAGMLLVKLIEVENTPPVRLWERVENATNKHYGLPEILLARTSSLVSL
eukprot:SAG31_NODE_3185_length_4579_cov_2.704911_6_plen_84_part_00